MTQGRPRFDVVLFDIDNVLVDTRASYLASIQKTVERYLDRPGVVSLKEIDQFKLLGGFNDDWDCSYGLITFLETARLSLSELGERFPERPLGIEGLLKNLRVLYERVETPSYQKISRLFQEVYWGKGRRPTGLVRKEGLVFPKRLLEKIRSRNVRLGIVTGRNRTEARYALRRFGIFKLFEVLVTIDDVRREEKKRDRILRKPHPWPILEAARRFGKKRFLYVGDLPDDILAAKQAKKSIRIQAAAFPKLARDPEETRRELKKVRPDFFLSQPADLLKIVLC